MDTQDVETKKFEHDVEEALEHPGVGSINTVVQHADEVQALLPGVVKETKAGYKTTEFWLTIAGIVATATDAVPTPDDAKGYILAALVVLYAVARGIAKQGIPVVEEPAAE